MNNISNLIIPVFILVIIVYGVLKKTNVYESFLIGAKEGLVMVFDIFPSILAMIFAINIFLDSNILVLLTNKISPFLDFFSIPVDIVPMALLRPISGTATLSLMNEIFFNYGPDSFIGFLVSILQGCTDTTFYVLLLYFGSIRIVRTRYALFVGLFADFIGVVLAIVFTNIFF
ncbi:MAG: spore maturation protein [bacterium]